VLGKGGRQRAQLRGASQLWSMQRVRRATSSWVGTVGYGLIAAVSLLPPTGCAFLSVAGERVKMTKEYEVIKDCRSLGKVSSTPPYGLPNEWKTKLRNEAGDLGGDTVWYEDPSFGEAEIVGEAYLCRTEAPGTAAER